MSSTPDPELLDARGVTIAPGDTAIYGFGVSRSVAMAEAVVLGETTHVRGASEEDCPGCVRHARGEHHLKLSLTASGRVRLRVVRRSYDSGTKPVVDVAPDRLVVLKPSPYPELFTATLPPSPLPTQAEEARVEIESLIRDYTDDLRRTKAPSWWVRPLGPDPEVLALTEWHGYCASKLAAYRRKLKALDE